MANKRNLGRSLKQFDFFASNITFKQDGSSSFGSFFGALTSLLITIIVASYGIKKFIDMINYDDTNFSDFKTDNALSKEVFDQEQLQFQIAFTAADNYYDVESK